MTDLFSLAGKRALITGATQGLGFAIAKGMADAGAQIIINARNPDKLTKAINDFANDGINVKGYIFDVTDSSTIDPQIEAIE